MNQLNFRSLLGVIAEQFDILPATGGAYELLQTPDEERRFEESVCDKGDKNVSSFAEPVNEVFVSKKITEIPRKQKHFFRYFIDGTVQTYVLGTGLEHDRTFPIVLAQIGAAALFREDNGLLTRANENNKLLLLLPFGLISSSSLQKIIEMSEKCMGNHLEVVDTTKKDDDLGDVKEFEDETNRSTGIAKSRMRSLEHKLAEKLGVDTEVHFIIDGTIRSGSFGWGGTVPKNAVAVSKSFSQQPKFDVFKKETEMKNVPRLLAQLQVENRTPAFFTSKGKVIFWYIRMREQGQVDYPLMGVIKVEIPAPGDPYTNASSEYIDLVSGCLLSERNVTPYGNDSRWHAHIYPVYATEQYIKSRFYSRDILEGMICWPRK